MIANCGPIERRESQHIFCVHAELSDAPTSCCATQQEPEDDRPVHDGSRRCEHRGPNSLTLRGGSRG
eukprot:3809059-Prymnesium_polylepis.1